MEIINVLKTIMVVRCTCNHEVSSYSVEWKILRFLQCVIVRRDIIVIEKIDLK